VIYSHFLDVHKWALLWIFTVFISYFLRAANFGPFKDLSIAIGVAAQLMASWEIGGSDFEVGWSWTKIIITWVFFTVAIQDFRDVPGDRACGRSTTPILLGDILGASYARW
jgi:4-hydroxybenzoate polyprenyltransferase